MTIAQGVAQQTEVERSPRLLWVIIAAFVIVSLLYSVIVPPFETPDEVWHFAFVQHLASGNGLPTSEPQTQALLESIR